jgi:soluble lytic murein transglycosylase-like protein
MKRIAALLLLTLPFVPAGAQSAPTVVRSGEMMRGATSAQLSLAQRSAYREVMAAIRGARWSEAAARLNAMPEGPLHSALRAELYLAKGSPRVELPQILPLLANAPHMPKAAQLARLAQTRGALELPPIPQAQNLAWAGSQPRRARPKSIKGDPIADTLEPQIQPLIVADQPAAAEALLTGSEFALSPAARAEFQQRIAWSHYLVGNDAAARQLALRAARQGSGEWALQGEWVAGLAAWRMGDCNAAAESFASVGARSGDPELMAAGNYWAARADMKCARPQNVQARLRTAARLKETFYGLLAASSLGIKTPNFSELHDYRDAEWRTIMHKPNVRTALALMEIGEMGLADEFIRHQARIGGTVDHDELLHLADDLNLASTQFWLAHNAPRGSRVNPSARYPMPDWQPKRGWRVDPALAYAHTLQESNFRTAIVSPAGATGLMQVRPGTAGDIARSRGEPFSAQQLTDTSANLEFGQSYLEYLRDHPSTGGLLPKVMAAYNAGPKPIGDWNYRQMDRGDPLLYIESIPYWETRGYVPIVLRNYWIYEQKAKKQSSSRKALAEGMWPKFPGMAGPKAVRLQQPTRLSQGTASGGH